MMSSGRLANRRIGLVAGVMLLLVLGVYCLAHLAGSGARADTSGSDPQPQPVLGTADASTVLMGAATAGEPGEAWAYKVLPLDVPAPANSSGRVAFAPASGSCSRRASSCSSAPATPTRTGRSPKPRSTNPEPALPRDAARTGLRRVSPRTAAGCSSAQDSTRPSGKQSVVLARDPGGRFQVLPEPPAGVLPRPAKAAIRARGCSPKATAAGAVADAAVENAGHTEAFFGALGRKQDTSRDPLERVRSGRASRSNCRAATRARFTIVALAGTTPQNMWLLGRASRKAGWGRCCSSASSTARAKANWQHVELGSALFAAERPRPRRTSQAWRRCPVPASR